MLIDCFCLDSVAPDATVCLLSSADVAIVLGLLWLEREKQPC